MIGVPSSQPYSLDWSWPYWLPVPLYPYGQRRTLRQEVVPGKIWTFDQIQGIFYVVVPIRMTVVRLAAGGLLVYAPVAPTPECLRLMQELVEQYGAVQHIILPTVSGLEHKVFVGPFARRFSSAQVWIAPHQWSFPLNLPLRWLGFPMQRVQVLPEQSADAPFADEFDYAMLGPIQLGLGPFAEVAFYHRASHSLLVTDSVLSVPNDPPAVVQLDPFPLLFHAKDDALDNPPDTPANRRKGWWRIALFAFYFQPSALSVPGLAELIRDAFKAPNRSKKAYFGLFPFRWNASWQQSFAALHRDGQLFVAPVLQQLILNRAPQTTLDWVERVASWEFEQILPCHLESPIAADSEQFRRAFAFLRGQPDLPESDFEFLRELEATLIRRGITPPTG
ncbi:MAG: DUF4336 domain-containing protein [Pegethrix bostrychoides GSE-TBD4-15B]|jgi:hypothetical protein|uniref:DUF4336 domain-containing protein n=1 Tax=Pegethrix bostrychoides GSE-TBD4-15B TaxID=2839662 RepID=A0A951U812_9CYAN|nr:DUF4336 domain-containing protein [Pegethrix bostrychoides GSE-TBD4-15B]